jgi:hypothetical protein
MQAKIKVKNGYWTYNGKSLANCTFPERQIVAQFIRNAVFSMEINEDVDKRDNTLVIEDNYNFEFVKL